MAENDKPPRHVFFTESVQAYRDIINSWKVHSVVIHPDGTKVRVLETVNGRHYIETVLPNGDKRLMLDYEDIDR